MVIARVELSGNINSRMAKQLRSVLSYILESKKFDAIVLVVNSGGGDANSSELLMEDILRIRETKPVFSIIQGTGASGAYWVASGSNKIYAMNTSIVGSIGVIGIAPNVNELMHKLGVKVDVLKVGEYKDMLNPFTESDKAALDKYRAILEHSYAVFKDSVSRNRRLSAEMTDKVATGEIYTSQKALDLGLIDKIGTETDVINDLVKAYGLKMKVREVSPRKSFMERLFTSGLAMNVISRLFQE